MNKGHGCAFSTKIACSDHHPKLYWPGRRISSYQRFNNIEVCTFNEDKTVAMGLVKPKLTEVFAAALRLE